jgi:cytochrome c5
LYDHALHGFTGSAGTMPAKGNRPDIPDAIIEAGVDQMMSMVKH